MSPSDSDLMMCTARPTAALSYCADPRNLAVIVMTSSFAFRFQVECTATVVWVEALHASGTDGMVRREGRGWL